MKYRQTALMILATHLLMASNPISIFAQTAGGTGGGGTGGGGTGGGGLTSGGGGGGTGGGGLGGGGGNTASSGFLSSGSDFSAGGPTIAVSGGRGGGSANSIPAPSNIFGSTYANPRSFGLPTNYYPNSGLFGAPNTNPPTFGKPLYTSTTTTTNTGVFGITTTTVGTGFSTIGVPRAPVYTTVLNEDVPFKSHSAPELFANVRAVIERSSVIRQKENIQVTIDGVAVVLSGQVGTEKERRITEGIVRMTPGVRDVRNELTVVGLK